MSWKECDFLMSLRVHYTNPGLPTARPLLCVRKVTCLNHCDFTLLMSL